MTEVYPVERHPLQPFIPDNTKVLMLGSFPPAQKRWNIVFYYPNFSNDMWRIFGIVFYNDKTKFIDMTIKKYKKEDIVKCLTENGIAIYDTACVIRRTKNTASDKDLEIIEATNLDELLRKMPQCKAIVTTGQRATDTFVAHFGIKEPKIGRYTEFSFSDKTLRLYRMPSSSRAYPMKVELKAEYYINMFKEIQNCNNI
jgi:hypoxanthine-DNA glycosylase